jgi:hypothetical protein
MTTATDNLRAQWLAFFNLDETCPAEEIAEEMESILGDGTFCSANEYIEAGVSPADYKRWYKVNGFDIESMKELEQAFSGDIEWLGTRTENKCGYSQTLAYQYCNGDLSMEELKALNA